MEEKLKRAKILGSIGAIIYLLSMIVGRNLTAPKILLLEIIGSFLVLLGVKDIADGIEKKEIFTDYIKAFILGIIASLITLPGLRSFSNFLMNFTNLPQRIKLGFLIFGCLLAFACYFMRKSYRTITEETDDIFFKRSGDLWFVGAISTLVGCLFFSFGSIGIGVLGFLIGFIIIFIGTIFEIIAFLKLPTKKY
jgi:uncharacterized membrane protein